MGDAHGHQLGYLDDPFDVVVVGGGNAAVVSALSARERVGRVLVLERAPECLRGGNTRHTRNIRCVNNEADEYCTGSYSYDELWADLCAVGRGPSDEKLAAATIAASEQVPAWMWRHGARWQRSLRGTLHLGRTNRFFLGGGKALLNSYYRTALQRGIRTTYGAHVRDIDVVEDRVNALAIEVRGESRWVRGSAFVFASGGFEADLDWLARYWGDAARNYLVRGTPFNDGSVLERLFGAGADAAGDERGFHSVAIDARAPKFDGGIATRIDAIPYGVVVDRHGRRFGDEGEELWPKRYASWGGKIAEAEGQFAAVVWDAKVNELFLPPMYGAMSAPSPESLAPQLGIDAAGFVAEIERYNAAVTPGRFDPGALDGCSTKGLVPQKSNWAQRLDTPPYFGVPVRPGVTFTYRGVRVDADARISRIDGGHFDNAFAAGEIMSGNILSTGYLAGFGMTIGTVWGRIAGASAANATLSRAVA